MSYKFQRLREKLRAAIASRELSGKLPGERVLAKRFHVNAKTLSKALTDLAAEGLLDRSIGRGTFVKGSQPEAPVRGRWLVVADSTAGDSPVIHALRLANADLHVAVSVDGIRPSYLNQFSAVIDIASGTPEAFLRDLVVRNMPVVAVNREPRTYSTHSVLVDGSLGATKLARDLLLAGHRRLAAVEPRGTNTIAVALQLAVGRYAPDATVDIGSPDDILTLLANGATAIVCGSCESAGDVKGHMETAGVRIPPHASLGAVGCIGEQAPCSGYYCSAKEVAEAVAKLLQDDIARPAVLWLAGTWHDMGTTGSTKSVHESPLRRQTPMQA